MTSWSTDQELFDLVKSHLYTPVVGDILDELGHYHQFLPQHVRPMTDDMTVVGRAMTVLMVDVFSPQNKPFGRLTEALDQLEPGDVYIAAGGLARCAYWGELLTATARTRGATGAVVDGWHRDTPQILDQSWPVFSRGAWAQDSSVRTQVIDYRCPIEMGQVTIHNGDVVFGDIDGVVVIPKDLTDEVIERALIKASGEKQVRVAIEDGMSATEAFATFGIL